MEVNFWNTISTLYINGIACAVRKNTILAKDGDRSTTAKSFTAPLSDEAIRQLTDYFSLNRWKTLFKKRVYFENDPLGWDYTTKDWEKVATHDGKIFEDEIKNIVVETTYTLCTEVSMKRLMEYPAPLVIEYLKERGITTCPLIK